MNQKANPSITATDNPTIELIIVSYDHARFMTALFESLAKVNYPKASWHIHVVINKDGDGTLERVKQKMTELGGSLPEVRIHEPHANLGFAGGNNLVMQRALRRKSGYVYLLNPDTEMEPDALTQAVKVATSHARVGSVQSLLLRGDNRQQLNSRGNALHFLGFGYARGDHDPLESAPQEPCVINYPSGAGVLIPIDTLSDVGLFEEALFAYHEDLDLGWRIRLSGRRNYLAPKSRVIHHYDFSRSISKWHLMERNRGLVILKNYKILTVIALLPALIATDVAIWTFAAKNGWLKQKLKASWHFCKPSTWSYLIKARERVNQYRRVPDYAIFYNMTHKVEYQELNSGWAEQIANFFWKALYTSYMVIINW